MTFRINLSSYNKIRRVFPKNRDESMASYFERLTQFLQQLNEEGKLYFLK